MIAIIITIIAGVLIGVMVAHIIYLKKVIQIQREMLDNYRFFIEEMEDIVNGKAE